MPFPTIAKVLVLAGSALSPLISAKIVHAIAPAYARFCEALLGGRPVPALTDAVVIRFAASNASLALALTVTILILLSVATVANPRHPANERTQALQLFLAFAGPFLSLVYLGTAFAASLLPFLAVSAGGG